MNGITWKDSRYATRYGLVSGLQFFTISWKSTRDDPNWVMSSALPGQEGVRWKDNDETVLRALAQTILDDWLRQVFGIRPNDPAYADPAFEHYAEVAELGHDIRPLMHEAFDAGWLARAGETQ